MKLAVDGVSCCVHHLKCVGAIAIHVAVAVRDAPVTEEEGDLVGSLWTKGDKVPEHIHILVGRERRREGGRGEGERGKRRGGGEKEGGRRGKRGGGEGEGERGRGRGGGGGGREGRGEGERGRGEGGRGRGGGGGRGRGEREGEEGGR